MTSPFRFDGTGEPETEEERRKRQLREAMRAAQLGLPLASQLPAVTITAPRPAAFDASERRTADLLSAFESALDTQRRLPEALKAAEAGIPLASRTQAPLPPVVITPENRYQAHPWTLAMNRAQMEREEAAKLPELPKQLTMGDIGRDIALQPLAASAGMVTRFGEGAARTVGAEGIAERIKRQRELVNEIAAPRTGIGQATRVGSELVTGALPYVAAGAGLPGLIRSAGMTALESRIGDEGSLFGTLAELTGQEQLQQLAASRFRTPADVAADVGFNVLPGAVRGAVRGVQQARRVAQAAPAGFGAAARAIGQEAVTAGREAVQGAGRQLRQMAEQQPGTLLASAAAIAGEAAAPGAGLLAAALPATTRRAGEAFPDKLFSRLERAITAAPFEKGTPQQWQAALSKGVAAGEREWVGIDDFLKNSQSPTLTKADVLGQFEQGKIRLGENVYDYSVVAERDAIKERQTKTQNAINELKDTLVKQTPEWKAMQQADDEYVRLVKESQKALQEVEVVTNEAIREAKDAIKKEGNFGFDSARDAWNEILFSHFDDTFKGATTPSWESQFDAATLKPETTLTVNRALATYDAYRKAGEPFIAPVGAARVRSENAKRAVDEAVNRIMVESPEVQRLNAEMSAINEELRQNIKTQPRWGSITQPGTKDNYREVVLTLDGREVGDPYRSTHWDEKNPLVHVRMTDRALPSGEKALFVEEIQSDWHQAGRKYGYKIPDTTNSQIEELQQLRSQALADFNYREAEFLRLQIEDIRNEMRELSKAVPQAPFKKTQDWAELGLKRVVQEAVDKGYDRVVMVRGEQAAETIARQLRQVKELGWATTDNGNTYTLQAIERPSDTQMATREIAKGIPAKDLSDYVGKDMADRIVTAAASAPEGTLSGIDLKVGGEGMKAFYDKIVPNTLRDLGKSMGLKIELEPVKLFTDGDNLSFRITPEVRQKVQTEGMRLYDITGAVPEAFRQTLASPAASAATGAIAGALTDEEDRFRGAVVGGVAGAGVGAGVRGTKALLRNRAALKASGLSPDLADAYTVAKGGIDFTGAEAQKIAKAQRGGWREVFKRGVDSFADAQRELDRLAGRAEARGMAPEASVGTALDIALSSDVTAARAIRSGMGVERGGIIDPITREFIGEPLEDVFKPLGGVAAKNEQALTYAVALRNVGRYDKAVSDLAQWDAMMAAGGPQGQRAVSMAMPSGAQRATRLRDLVGTQGETVPAAGAMAAKPDPMAVYGGNAERLAADRAIVEAFSQKPEFREFATRMEQYFNNLSEYAVRSGLWTPQQAQAIRESDTFYVPFKRLIEAYTGGGAGPMRGGITPGQVGPGVKRFTGSDLMVGNPAETIASYTAALIRRADMYRVGSTLIDTVEQLGPEAASLLTKIDAGDPMARALGVADAEAAYRQLGLPEEEAKQVADLFVRMDDKNPVIFRNTPAGKEYYLVNDPAVYNALMTLNPQDGQAAKAIVAIFGPLKRLGTAFATGYSPQFWFGTNIPRDLVVGLAQNPNITVGDIAVGIKEAAKSVVGRSEMVEQLSRAGMGQVSQYGGPPSPEALARQIAPTSTGQAVMAEATSALGAPLRGLERVGRATELPMRLAAARAAQRTAAEAGVSPRGQMALASRRGATATVDFRRRAGNAFERLLEGTVMYYGAAKKGGVWFARAVKNNPKQMGAAAGVITLGTVLEYMMSKGEERREFVDRPASERARYLHVGPARVALPQEFAALAAGVRVGLAQLEQDDPFVFEQFKQSLFNMLPPIYTDLAKGDIAAAVTPFPVARQAVELSRNRSAFGDRPIVSQSMERRLPEARRYETTAPTYDVLARGARAIGLEEASPIQAEFAARGIFGRFAPAVTALTDIAAAPMAGQQAAERVPLPMSRQPLNPVTGFTARPVTRGQSEQEFYSIRSEVQQAKATLSALATARKEAAQRGDQQAVDENTAQVKRLVAENPTFAAVFADRNTKRIDKVFSSLEDKLDAADARRDAITTQFRNKKLTGERARRLLDENDKKRAELFRRGFEVLNERVPR